MDSFIYGLIGPCDTDCRSWPFPRGAKSQLIADWSIKCRFLESAYLLISPIGFLIFRKCYKFHTFIFRKNMEFCPLRQRSL